MLCFSPLQVECLRRTHGLLRSQHLQLTSTSQEHPFERAEHCQSPLHAPTQHTSKYAPIPELSSDTADIEYRCSPAPSHASRPPPPAAASTPPLARWARPTTTLRALAATFPSTLSPSGSPSGTGASWVRAPEREIYAGLGTSD
jgi:hypothetical protein